MPPNRQDAERQFWQDVEAILKSDYGRTDAQAAGGVAAYQAEIRARKMGEVVYNGGKEEAAQVVDYVIEHGSIQTTSPQPTP